MVKIAIKAKFLSTMDSQAYYQAILPQSMYFYPKYKEKLQHLVQYSFHSFSREIGLGPYRKIENSYDERASNTFPSLHPSFPEDPTKFGEEVWSGGGEMWKLGLGF
jgi:hypothetical protein